MRKHSKILICLVLVVVLAFSAIALASCSINSSLIEKRGGNDKAIVLVTALMSGGLYDGKTNEALWDPFYLQDVTLPDVLALLEADDLVEAVNETGIVDKVLGADFASLGLKDASGTTYDSIVTYAMDLLGNILAFPTNSRDFSGLTEQQIVEERYKPGYYIDREDSEESDLYASLLYNLSLNQKGESLNKNVKPSNDYVGPHKNLPYGVMGAYKSQITTLTEEYPNYDVVIFNYDWRLDVEHNEELFEQFLAEKKYKKIILTTHSLGGQVCNQFLAKSQANRDLVEGFIMYSPATLGATMALAYLNNAWDALDDYIGMVDNIGDMTDAMGLGDMSSMIDMVMNSVMNAVDDLMNVQAAYFLQNLSSVIQLLPSFKMLETYHDDFGSWILKDEDGNDIDTEDKLFAYYERRPWAWKYNEETGEWLMENGKHVLKDKVASLREHQHSLYVEKDGKEVLAADLVKTYYLIGAYKDTMVTYNESIDAGWTYSLEDARSTVNKYTKMEGDGIVPMYSLLCGHTEAEIEALYGEGHVIKYRHEHNVVGTDFTNVTGTDVKKIITELGW